MAISPTKLNTTFILPFGYNKIGHIKKKKQSISTPSDEFFSGYEEPLKNNEAEFVERTENLWFPEEQNLEEEDQEVEYNTKEQDGEDGDEEDENEVSEGDDDFSEESEENIENDSSFGEDDNEKLDNSSEELTGSEYDEYDLDNLKENNLDEDLFDDQESEEDKNQENNILDGDMDATFEASEDSEDPEQDLEQGEDLDEKYASEYENTDDDLEVASEQGEDMEFEASEDSEEAEQDLEQGEDLDEGYASEYENTDDNLEAASKETAEKLNFDFYRFLNDPEVNTNIATASFKASTCKLDLAETIICKTSNFSYPSQHLQNSRSIG